MYPGLRAEVLPQLIVPNSKILAAVSGGPDSVALAHLICRYLRDNPDQNLSLVISHINHRARKEAEEEAQLVKRLAEQWGVPFILHEFNAKENAVNHQKSFQEASREWRYARWQEDMKKYGCNLLATAHHLGDQAETVLYRLLRGSGTAGLAGIYPIKDQIIRPLLSVSKKEILEYCRAKGLPYALDKSNLEPLYDRNRIRIELLPELEKKYNERIQEALARTAELLRWDEEYINSQVERIWPEYCRHSAEGQLLIAPEAWEQPEAVLSRLLRKAAAMITGEPRGLEYKFIRLIMKEGRKTGWRQDLPGIKVEATRNGFLFFRRELEQGVKQASCPRIEEYPKDWEISLTLERWQLLPCLGLQAGIFRHPVSGTDILWETEFNLEKILALEGSLVWRLRRPGDRMFFANLGHKTIKKVFQDFNIPARERNNIPLLAADKLVLWIPGVCKSDSLVPADETTPKFYGRVTKI
jgi:tRNA(Ile)-lysidine synthase